MSRHTSSQVRCAPELQPQDLNLWLGSALSQKRRETLLAGLDSRTGTHMQYAAQHAAGSTVSVHTMSGYRARYPCSYLTLLMLSLQV
jgi:hypothetical protein